MQRGSFVGAEIVVDHDDFDLGPLGQVGRLISGDASVLHLDFERVHAAQPGTDRHLEGSALKSWQLAGFAAQIIAPCRSRRTSYGPGS